MLTAGSEAAAGGVSAANEGNATSPTAIMLVHIARIATPSMVNPSPKRVHPPRSTRNPRADAPTRRDAGLPHPEDEMPDRLHAKVVAAAGRAARRLLVEAITLAVVARRASTPAWARATITSALAYFLLPVDALPDLLPGGYSDDLSMVLAAAWTVAAHVRPEDREAAEGWLSRWVGPPREVA